MIKRERTLPILSLVLALMCTTVYAQQIAQPTSPPPQEQKQQDKASPSPSNTPQALPAANLKESPSAEQQIPVSGTDINRLLVIAEELRSQKEAPRGWLDRLDASLDSSLAASMAGLSIAAATFLISFAAPMAQRIKEVRDRSGEPAAADTKVMERMKIAVNQLMAAFYVFVGFLVQSLTVDQWEEPGSWLNQYAWAKPSDVVIAAGCLAVGIYLLGSGARTIRSIVIE